MMQRVIETRRPARWAYPDTERNMLYRFCRVFQKNKEVLVETQLPSVEEEE